MVELCRQRVGGGEFRQHDLADPLDWLGDGSVDLVLLALAIEYIDDRVAMLRELRRLLRPDGALVLSRLHPTGDWLRHGGNYFERRVIEETWSQGWHVRYWLAPLEATCDELYQAGFLIQRLIEPRPAPSAAELDPEDFPCSSGSRGVFWPSERCQGGRAGTAAAGVEAGLHFGWADWDGAARA